MMTVRTEVGDAIGDTTARLLAATEPGEVPATLADMGWFDLWEEDREAAARALFGQQGRLVRTSPMLSLLIGAEIGGRADGYVSALLPMPAVGAGGWTPADGGSVVALAQADALDIAELAVSAVMRDGRAELVGVPVSDLDVETLSGIDADAGLCRVDASRAVAAGEVIAFGQAAEQRWSVGYALGHRLLAEEISGLVGEQLRIAVEYAKSRTQFGRAIGSYQAVKHKLAEVHVAAQTARLAARDAWISTEPVAALAAKVHAGDAVEVANKHCLQVLGGIGFTWEHPFHTYYRRGLVLDALLGSAQQLCEHLGATLIADKKLPAITDL